METESLETRVYNLVEEKFNHMTFSKKESNRARLSNACQRIIYNDWGFSNQYTWELIDKYVEEFISEEQD